VAFGALSLKGRALRYLAQREHSRAELERKLERFAVAAGADGGHGAGEDLDENTQHTAAQAQLARALDELAAAGLLSDNRAAESVLGAQGRRFGNRRLKQLLQQKGLAPELVSQTLQQAKLTELARAHEVWRRRFGAPAADAAERAKQMRFLAGRGFDGDVIRRVVQGLDDTDCDTDRETDETSP
jgi:regulatory protein